MGQHSASDATATCPLLSLSGKTVKLLEADMKIGIAVDNYKIEKFKAALNDAGFEDLKVMQLYVDTSLITVDNVPAERLHDIHKLCKKLQINFNHAN